MLCVSVKMLLNRPHAIFSVGILMPKLGCRELEILNRAMKSEGLNQQDPPPDNLTNQLSTLKFSFNFFCVWMFRLNICLSTTCTKYLLKPDEAIRCPGTEFTDDCELLCR